MMYRSVAIGEIRTNRIETRNNKFCYIYITKDLNSITIINNLSLCVLVFIIF